MRSNFQTVKHGNLNITGGLYLVVDPAPGASQVIPKVEAALRGGVAVLQIWNNWQTGQDKMEFFNETVAIAHQYGTPVLVNNDFELLQVTGADGIHFDAPDLTPAEVHITTGRRVLIGLTCGNDLELIKWAIGNHADYLSFCAMYPSHSVDSCEIVDVETIRKTRSMTSLPLFASGGITPDNAAPVLESGADGIAVISGILRSDNPEEKARNYNQIIRSIKTSGKSQ